MGRLAPLVTSLEAAAEAPEADPIMSSASMGVNFQLPLENGHVGGGAHEMVAGPSPGPMIDLAFQLANFALEDPAFTVRRAYRAAGGRPGISPKLLVLIFENYLFGVRADFVFLLLQMNDLAVLTSMPLEPLMPGARFWRGPRQSSPAHPGSGG